MIQIETTIENIRSPEYFVWRHFALHQFSTRRFAIIRKIQYMNHISCLLFLYNFPGFSRNIFQCGTTNGMISKSLPKMKMKNLRIVSGNILQFTKRELLIHILNLLSAFFQEKIIPYSFQRCPMSIGFVSGNGLNYKKTNKLFSKI
jgi:hypothetical protein